jgi:PhoH-like ATPase
VEKFGEKFSPNMGVVLKGQGSKDHGIVKGSFIKKFQYPEAFGIKPKNTEQTLAMAMLLDNDIKLKMITGKEGTGKNYITAACVLELLLSQHKYNKVILTRTTDEVGKTLGLFPGSADEKFANHTASFRYTFKAIMGADGSYVDMMMDKGQIEYIPVQLMRGISFPPGTLVWADEIAGLSPYELRMLGTRLGEDCCLILTGSFEQIDRKVKPEETGMWKLVNGYKIKNSHLSSHIELLKNERSALSNLISDTL